MLKLSPVNELMVGDCVEVDFDPTLLLKGYRPKFIIRYTGNGKWGIWRRKP